MLDDVKNAVCRRWMAALIRRSSRSSIASIVWSAVMLAALIQNSMAATLGPLSKAILEKQVFLEQHEPSIVDSAAGNPKAIVPLPDGGFVLAGSTLSAWASRVNADGTIAWRYVDPRDGSFKMPNQSQSEFTGAVGLADGSVALCGSRWSSEGEAGLLAYISRTGELLSREIVKPSMGMPLGLSSLDGCMAWGEGLVLFGIVPRSPMAAGWMIRLVPGGRRVWEKAGDDYLLNDAVTLPDQTLILARRVNEISPPPEQLLITSILVKAMTPDGVVTHQRSFPCKVGCENLNLVRNVDASADVFLEFLDGSNTLIYRLGPNLLNRAPPVHSTQILARLIFRLGSGALIFFGQGPNEAIVSSMDPRGQLQELYAFKPVWDDLHRGIKEESLEFNDVAVTSENRFVSARQWTAPLEHRGIYVEWFRIQ
jgi:hypothetical protein